MIAIRQWHKLQGYPDPTSEPLVKKTLRGIIRKQGIPRKQALLRWRQESKCVDGNVLRRFSPKGTIQEQGIGDHHFNRMIQKRATEAKCLDAEDRSAHSLRRGFATEAARKGASMPAIKKHGRWKRTQTVLEYIEAGREFKDSAVNVLFEEVKAQFNRSRLHLIAPDTSY